MQHATPDPIEPGSFRGIGFALLAFALFTAMDCTVKVLAARYHIFQVVWLQNLVALLVMLAVTMSRGGFVRLHTRRPWLHVFRALLSVFGITAVFYSYARLPLADVYAVLFTVPLLVTALSAPLLGERVGIRRWAAVCAGFSGVLVMIGPGGGLTVAAALMPLAAALATAIGFVMVRKMQATETTESLSVYSNLGMLVALAPLLPPVFLMPSLMDVVLSVIGGALGAAGFMLLVAAYRAAPAAVVAPFQYSQMPYGVLAGLLLFGDRPQLDILLGAAIVAASSAYILHREAAHRRDAAPRAAFRTSAQAPASAQASQ
jgi:drug/metabolite transporter (DMT)-like permease